MNWSTKFLDNIWLVLLMVLAISIPAEIFILRQAVRFALPNENNEAASSPRIPFEATFENTIEYCYRGKVINIVDGDTIDVQLSRGFDDYTVKRFRLSGINAPEMKDVPKGEEAKKVLTDLIFSKSVIVKTKKDQTDRYGRFLGTIYLDEGQLNVNEHMVKIGQAKIY